jgi:hypothetical protein
MDGFANRVHHWFAEIARLYLEERDLLGTDIPDPVNGQYYFLLAEDVIDLDEHSVRLFNGLAWAHLKKREYPTLVHKYGALESVATGTPLYYYRVKGSKLTDERKVGLVPPPTTAIMDQIVKTIRYRAWVHPLDLVTDGDEPPFPPDHHQKMIPAINWMMAKTEFSMGRVDPAIVALHENEMIRQGKLLMAAYGRDPNLISIPVG